MPDDGPPPNNRRRWLRQLLITFGILGLAVYFIFRDEDLKPVDDLMPQRLAIAWDDNNGWKRLAAFSRGLPLLTQESLQQLRRVKAFEQEPVPEDAKKLSLTAAQLTELESIAAMPRFQARLCADLQDAWDDDLWAISTLEDIFVFTLVSAMEEGDTALFLRSLKLSASLQKRMTAGATSMNSYRIGVSWISDEVVALALVRLPWTADELKELADTLAHDPVVLEELQEAMRHEFQLTHRSILSSGGPPEEMVSTGPGPPARWWNTKNLTANLLAEAVRRNIKVTLVTPWSGIVPAATPYESTGSYPYWLDPTRYGKYLVWRHGFSPEISDRQWRPANGKRRAMQVIMSLHRYYPAHGAPPSALKVLVPEFLPAIPLDPFDFAPLRWHAALRAVQCTDLSGTLSPPDPKQVKPVSVPASVFLFRTKAEEDARRAALPPPAPSKAKSGPKSKKPAPPPAATGSSP